MKVTMYNKPDPSLSGKFQVLYNRGLEISEIDKYINSTDDVINSELLLGEESLKEAAKKLIKTISQNKKLLIIVDSDNDGYTSAAILINYLREVFPAYGENNIDWYIHSGKQHGLADCVDLAKQYPLVICPDSGSNDVGESKILVDNGCEVFCLDHHEVDCENPYMTIVNNQSSEYPNKELSGAGVTWQFCRYLDKLLKKNYADEFIDLVALGLMGDVMSMRSIETKHLIFKGFHEDNIKNPFIYNMADKNEFSLNKSDYKPSRDSGLKFSPMGAAFFIVPFVNAIVRSGTQEEKELVFKSMLKTEAFKLIPSTKRGHKIGETERVIDQALRTCTNVKNRQTRAIDLGMELLEDMIIEHNLLEHKVILFLLEPGQIDRNIAGLCANKIMGKYQRPCCVLTKVIDKDEDDGTITVSYQGSARGYGDMNFKAICSEIPMVLYATGHANAFGLGIDMGEEGSEIYGEGLAQFIDITDRKFKDLSSEPSYYIDYAWHDFEIDPEKILEVASINDYLGKDIERPYVALLGIEVGPNNFKVMKSNTLKIILPNKIDIIMFGGTEEQIELFSQKTVRINAVCKCLINEFNYQELPQLVLVDYEVLDIVIEAPKQATLSDLWGF